jgi:hypothetical protein
MEVLFHITLVDSGESFIVTDLAELKAFASQIHDIGFAVGTIYTSDPMTTRDPISYEGAIAFHQIRSIRGPLTSG